MENGEKKTVSRTVIDREVIMRKYHVHIKNFRNLKDVKVTLSPLTILTGENGSGKSTFFKALLFLKHNHTHEAAKKLKYVIDDDINLGGWDQIANDPKKPISIKITEETWGYEKKTTYPLIGGVEIAPIESLESIDADKFQKYLGSSFKEIKHRPISYEVGNKFTKSLDSCEFIFSSEGLQEKHYSLINGRIGYTIRNHFSPFDERIGKIITLNWFPFDVTHLVEIDRISVKNRIKGCDLPILIKEIFQLHMLFEFGSYNNLGVNEFAKYYYNIFIQKDDTVESSRLNVNLRFLIDSVLLQHGIKSHSIGDYLEETIIYILSRIDFLRNNFFNDLVSFGTVREIPKRLYLKENFNCDTYYGILSTIVDDSLVQSEITSFEEYDDLEEKFSSLLKYFEIGSKLISVVKDETVALVVENLDGKSVPLSEMSSGTLQLLPLLFHMNFGIKSKKKYLIQQPELHLHPRLQSKLAVLFVNFLSVWVDNIQKRASIFDLEKIIQDGGALNEFGIEYRPMGYRQAFFLDSMPNAMVVETHSEHLLKKIQLLVSRSIKLRLWYHRYCSGEDVKLKDALSIYYFAKDAKGNTKAIEMELDDNGFFKTETPKGFFDESLDLNRQLLLGRN